MKEKIRIGYQGEEYSFNNQAAIRMAEKLGLECEFIPLIDSQNVVNALNSGKIDYGVMAFQNTLAGIVPMTYEATSRETFELIDTEIMQISHYLYGLEKNRDKIKSIVSHPMAIKQCKLYLKEKFPDAKQVDSADGAMSARLLSEGNMDKDCLIICPKEAGEAYKLNLMDERIQDSDNNYTEFRMYKIREVDDSISPFHWLQKYLYSDDKNEIVFKVFVALLFLGFFYFYENVQEYMNPINASWFASGLFVALFLLVSNKRARNRYYHSFIKGYWTYTTVSDDGLNDAKQHYTIPRVAEIYEDKGELKIDIYIANNSSQVFAKSVKTLHSKLDVASGQLVYWYDVPNLKSAEHEYRGIVYMDWKKKKKNRKIVNFSAKYFGERTRDQGTVNYSRISKEEYERIKTRNFLTLKES